MGEEIKQMVKWFEELLEVDGIQLRFGSDFSDGCSSCKKLYDIDGKYLTRKILYFDKSNKTLMTHAPGGSHWLRNNNMQKIVFNENVRWVMDYEIRGVDVIGPTWVVVEDNKHNVLKSRDIITSRFSCVYDDMFDAYLKFKEKYVESAFSKSKH